MSKYTKTEQAEAIARLKEWVKPGDTVYTILRHSSRSGMVRDIGCVVFRDGSPLHPNYAIACALGWTLKRDAVRVNGCGMDMGFHLIHELSAVLGFKLRQEWL